MSRNKPNHNKFTQLAIIPTGENHEALKRYDYRTAMTLGNMLQKIKTHVPDHVEDLLHEKVRNGTITTEESALMFLTGAMAVLTALTGENDLVPAIWLINGLSGRSAVESDPQLAKKLEDG